MKKFITLVFTLVVVFACSKKTVGTKTETSEKTSSDKVSNEIYLAGKTTYMEKCGKCHPLFPVNKGNMEYWNKWVDKMAPKAKLTDEQKRNVLDYLSVNAPQ